MESLNALFLSLELSQLLREKRILFDDTIAIRHSDDGRFALRKSMFTIIPSIHVSAPTAEELYALLPKKIMNEHGTFFLMQSVDENYEIHLWYENEDENSDEYGQMGNCSAGELKEAYATLILTLLINEIVDAPYINQKLWAK